MHNLWKQGDVELIHITRHDKKHFVGCTRQYINAQAANNDKRRRHLAKLEPSKPGAIRLKDSLPHERKGVFWKASFSRCRSPYLEGDPAGLRYCQRACILPSKPLRTSADLVHTRHTCHDARFSEFGGDAMTWHGHVDFFGMISCRFWLLCWGSVDVFPEVRDHFLPKMLHSVSMPGFGMMSDTSIMLAAHIARMLVNAPPPLTCSFATTTTSRLPPPIPARMARCITKTLVLAGSSWLREHSLNIRP